MLNNTTAAHDLVLFSFVDSTCEGEMVPFWADKAQDLTCSCPKCERVRHDAELDRLYADEMEEYLMTREEERYFDYFAELRGWHREEDWYRSLDQEADQEAARFQAQADQLVIAAYLAGAAV
jgi:hypothetical protein